MLRRGNVTINFQVIKKGIVTIINDRGIILMEEVNEIQIGHIEVMQSIGASMDKVGNYLFSMSKNAQVFPYELRIVIAFPVDQIF